MKRMMIALIVLAMLSMLGPSVAADENLVQSVLNGCKVELEKYCSQVTPGQGRILGCLLCLSGQAVGEM
jgi:hypothetical protein